MSDKQSEEHITKNNEDFEELINSVPDDIKEDIMESITAIRSTQHMSIPPEAIVMSKINEDHITEFLAASKENMIHSYAEKKQNKIFTGFLILVAMIFIIIIILLLRNQPEVMEKIIYIFLGFLGGAAGGYGLGKHKRDTDDD